ncbi:hypothetical protein MPSEU_000381000 [Mayamaea pseudoterrestris]|nr:hypothetical protein MPSEU_000381000 [Mayamaea pseudoterrestris]
MDQAEERKARQTKAMDACWKAAREGVGRLLEEAKVYKGTEAHLYRGEATMIMEHVTPFYWGLATASFLFITFRVTGSKRFQLYRDAMFQRKPSTTTTRNGADPAKQQWKSLIERQTEEKAELANDLTRLPFDFFVSILGGCSTILLLSKPDKMGNDFVNAPLMPGKSLIYKTICPPLQAAYDEQDPNVFQETNEGMLVIFEAFVKNCRIRTEFIKQQTLRGVARSDAVPYPGLKGASE